MPHRAPPIPPAQRFHLGEKPHIEGSGVERRDEMTDMPSRKPGDPEATLKSQGRHVDRHQGVETVQQRRHQAR